MVKIKIENILKELMELKPGEMIFVSIDKDVSNMLQLLDLKSLSYQNLFNSYINNTSEVANEMNLNKFLEADSKLFCQLAIIKQNVLKENLKDAFEYFSSNKFRYDFNYALELLVITSMNERVEND